MRPAFARSYPLHLRRANAELAGERCRTVRGLANLLCNRSRYFRTPTAFASRCCAVIVAICVVFPARRPAKVAEVIVHPVAIAVSDHMLVGRRFTEERYRNKPVDGVFRDFSAVGQSNTKVSRSSHIALLEYHGARALASGQTSHAPHAADCVIRRERYRLPNLVGIIGVSHGVSPHVRGQGRAVCPAPFRPANDSRFPRIFQRKAA